MRLKLFIIHLLLVTVSNAQNVGIGTISPLARLHVADSAVLFTGPLTVPFSTPYGPPASGAGTRMMWYPQKAAFRVGVVNGSFWDKDNIGLYSFCSGYNTQATGESSVSMGNFNYSGGDRSFTSGSGNTAIGYASTSIGESNYSTGNYSISMGYNTYAIGQVSTGLGNRTKAGGDYSTSMGDQTYAIGNYSTSMGSGSVAMGTVSTSMGADTKAAADYSTAMGLSTTAKSDYSLVIGLNNDSSNTDRLFEIGNGVNPSSRHNAFTVLKNGNVGISTAAPVTRLDVEGLNNWDLSSTEGDMRIGNGTYRIKMGIALDGGGAGAATIRAVGGIQQLNLGAGTSTLITMNGGTGNVGIGTTNPTQKLQVIGNICATGSIAACSDIRYKTNLQPLPQVLASVMQLHPLYYNWKPEYIQQGFADEKYIGFSAQEVEKYFPEIVQTTSDGYKSVDYSRLTPVLVQAIKEQQQQIEELKQVNNELKNMKEEMAQLKEVVAKMKKTP